MKDVKNVLWIFAGLFLILGVAMLSSTNFSLVASTFGSFAIGKVAIVFIAGGAMVAAVAGGTK
jgi:hypothetical protein